MNNLRESYVNGELFKEGDQVVIKESGEIGTVKRLGSNYVIIEGSGNQYRKWLDAVELVDETQTKYEIANFSTKMESLSESMQEREDPDIGDRKGSQPANYHAGLKKSTKIARDRQFKKQAKMADDNPKAYKPAPGDKKAKTKPSKHTMKFKQMFGENEMQSLAKKRIEREKQMDKIKHDRMMDRARTRDTMKKNKETK